MATRLVVPKLADIGSTRSSGALVALDLSNNHKVTGWLKQSIISGGDRVIGLYGSPTPSDLSQNESSDRSRHRFALSGS